MSKRDVYIAAGVVVALAATQSLLMIPLALVLLGRWAFLDATARRVPHPLALAFTVSITWPVMLPVYLATRPLAAGEVRVGGTTWNISRAFAATYAVGAGLLVVRYLPMVMFAMAWAGMADGRGLLRVLESTLAGLTLVAVPAVAALGVGLVLRRPIMQSGPTGPLAAPQAEHVGGAPRG